MVLTVNNAFKIFPEPDSAYTRAEGIPRVCRKIGLPNVFDGIFENAVECHQIKHFASHEGFEIHQPSVADKHMLRMRTREYENRVAS